MKGKSYSLSLNCEYKPHPWRHKCVKCNKPRSGHELSVQEAKRFERVLSSIQESSSLESMHHHIYAWLPYEIPKDRISQYFSNFPRNMVPEHDSPGLLNHMRQVAQQIPRSDLAIDDSDPYRAEERQTLTGILSKRIKFGFIKEWKDNMPPQCPTCHQLFEEKELTVISKETPYHPTCFVCFVCKEPLAQLIHCAIPKGKGIYCLRHFSERFKKRCYACDELIFDRKYSEAAGVFYHRDHLRCFECDERLAADGSFEDDEQLHCKKCYEKKYSKECETCKRMVDLDATHVVYENRFWHSGCFKCSLCGELLKTFTMLDDKSYCETCYKYNLATTCVNCGKSLKNEKVFAQFQGKQYHPQCFRCEDCRAGFTADDGFLPHEGTAYCRRCYIRRFGTRCSKCQLPVTDEQVVVYRETPYHTTCFTCCKCYVQLARNPFKAMGENTYCLSCFRDTFCKSCHFCQKPIKLGDNDKLYSYKNNNWHQSCFKCQICRESLEKCNFIMRGTILVCKDCVERAVEKEKRELEAAVAPGEEEKKLEKEEKDE